MGRTAAGFSKGTAPWCGVREDLQLLTEQRPPLEMAMEPGWPTGTCLLTPVRSWTSCPQTSL